MEERNKRVLVGMSGGIDSTATCLMLQEQGYEIVPVSQLIIRENFHMDGTGRQIGD